jgi:hypothetical protein
MMICEASAFGIVGPDGNQLAFAERRTAAE